MVIDVNRIFMTAMKTILAYVVFIVFFFGTPVVQGLWEENGGLRALITDYKNGVIATTPIKVEVVRDQAARTKRLSGRESLGTNVGMLFIFPEKDKHGIWMKDMKFPIDIIWLDAGYFVVDYKKNAQPSSYPEVFKPTQLARYVLEVNSGFIDKNFIKIGDQFSFY